MAFAPLAKHEGQLVVDDLDLLAVDEELAAAARALAGHAVRQHLAAPVHADGPRVQRAHVEHGAGARIEIDAAAPVRRHRVEVAGMERDALALARRGAIRDIAARKAGILEREVVGFGRELEGIALAQLVDAPRQPLRGASR